MSIDNHHQAKMNYFREIENIIIPNLVKEKHKIKQKIKNTLDYNTIFLYKDEISNINTNIRNIKYQEKHYLLDNMHILEVYYTNINLINENKHNINNTLHFFNKQTINELNFSNNQQYWKNNGKCNVLYYDPMICSFCNGEIVQEYCTKCYSINKLLVDNSCNTNNNNNNNTITDNSYKRIIHLKKILNQMNGKNTMKIPNTIITDIRNRMKLQKIELLNYDLLYDILQKLKLKKYFYQINHILSIFNVKIDVMDYVLIDSICHIFTLLQGPFNKYRVNTRSNFFSYNFIIYKILEYLNETTFIKKIPKLKNVEKERKQNELFNLCIKSI